MSGVTGWVDHHRDLREHGSVLRGMVGSLAHRGPDAEAVWLDAHVGLGHRRLSVLDHQGGTQPMTVSTGNRTVTLGTSGLVGNYRELRHELTTRGQHCTTDSDTEVVARAYIEWAEEFLPRLEGAFTCALWDHDREQLLLARDQLGCKPLYYSLPRSGVVFGSEPKAVLAHPLVTPMVDADGLREALAFVNNPGNTVFRDLHELPPGCALRFARDAVRTWQYWQLTALEHRDDLETTIANVRSLLDTSIDRQLIADVPVGSLLSGGLDSSAVTALAGRKLETAGHGPVRSFSVDFTGYAENFTPDAMRDAPDTPYVRAAAEHIGAEHVDLVLSSAQLTDRVRQAGVTRASDLPQGGDMFTSLHLLAGALRRHVTVALCGESADEIFGGYPWFHNEAAWANTFPWLASGDQPHGDERPVHSLFRADLLSTLDISDYQQDSYRAALSEVPHTDTTDATERRMREVSYLHLTRFGPYLFNRQDRMCMAHGLDMRLPICTPELVQYVFNTPWHVKTFDGREKSLLREATRDLLPASIADRKKSPYPSTQDPNYEAALREQVRNLLREDESPVLELVDRQRASSVLDSGAATDGAQAQRTSLEIMLALHDWLNTTGARLDVTR